MQTSVPSGPTNPIHLGRVVQGADKSTQFPSAIEDALERPLRVIWARLSCLQKVDPLFERLTRTKNQIDRLRRHLEVIKRWTAHPEHQSATSIATWNQLEGEVSEKLRKLEAEFWELNVPDIQERSRLRILERIAYKAQAEGRARDLSDFLSDESFPRIRDLGRASKRALPEPSSLVPKKGPARERLGSFVSETPDPNKESSASGQTQDRPTKVRQDPPKGQESQVSQTHTQTQNTRFAPDTRVQGREQGQKPKTKRLNPRRRLALRLGKELDLRVPLGAPRSREEAGAAGSAPPRSEKRARKAQLNPPKASDGPSGGPESTPRAPIDLTAEPSDTVAPPPTPSQGEGRADPKGPGKAQEGGEQRADHQGTSLKEGRVTPDHWEDEFEGSTGDPQSGRAGSGEESPSVRSDETEFEF